MSDAPVLKRLLILRDERLPFIDLDLTDPETGSPLDEICLIGPNACGKSTLLARLHEAMTGRSRWMELGEAYFLAKWQIEGGLGFGGLSRLRINPVALVRPGALPR